MPNELFGTPGGFRAYEEDQNQLNALALKAAMLPGEQAFQRAQTAHQASLSSLNAAQARGLDAKAVREEALAKMLAASGGAAATGEAPPGVPGIDDLLKKFRLVTDVSLAAGDISGAKEALDAATQGAQRQAAADASKASEELRTARTAQLRYTFVQERLSAVTDQRSYDLARATILSSPIMAGQDVSDLPSAYNPAIVRAIVANSKAANDKIELELKRADLARKQNDSKIRNAARDTNEKINKAKADAYIQWLAFRQKAGGASKSADDKPVGVASPEEATDASNALKSMGLLVGGSKEEKAYQAQQIADEAKYIRTRRNVSQSEALAIAIREAVERGDISTEERTLLPDRKTYKSQEGSYARPLSLKDGMTQADLVVGRYYRMPNGRIEKWEGPPAAPTGGVPRPPANNPLADDDEDED